MDVGEGGIDSGAALKCIVVEKSAHGNTYGMLSLLMRSLESSG